MIYFITGNDEKFREVQEIISDINIERKRINLPELQAVDSIDIIADKALRAVELVQAPIIVEDGGFHLDAYNGFPGAQVKWLLERASVQGLWNMVQHLENRRASIKLAVAYCEPEKKPVRFEGIVHGTVVEPAGDKRFYFDQVFIQDGYSIRWSEMPMSEKNRISHRFHAFSQLKDYLLKQI